MIIKRAVSVTEMINKKRKLLPFTGEMLNSFGSPELGTQFLIWGDSGSGKTSLALQISKYMCEIGFRVAYNSLEQGDSKSFKDAIVENNMYEVSRKFIVLDREPISETIVRFKKHKSPDVLVIDTIQYSRLKYNEYIAMKSALKGKMLIILSQEKNKMPKGSIADDIRFDVDIKVHVEGFKAFPMSRFGGGKEYVIYPQGALEYWGFNKVKNKVSSKQ